MTRTLLIGVDVGGTNTDSVLVDPLQTHDPYKCVLSWNKMVTTKDVSKGIQLGIEKLFEDSKDIISKSEVTSVTIGTTHFINAIVEQDAARLTKVAVFRLVGPYASSIPPFADFPSGLREIMEGYVAYLQGGYHVDGNEIQPIDEKEVLSHIEQIRQRNIKTVAVIGTFSSLKPDQEIYIRDLILKHIPDVKVVLSHKVSGVGFIERENASILNASILPFAETIIHSFVNAISQIGLNCPILLTQNDGTVLSAYESLELPIRTFSSGTTNSMRGASILGNLKGKSAIVVDVGGTTCDVGLLLKTGFPRQSSSYSFVGGVRMNFAMPHVESIGLGGGSIVKQVGDDVFIGPESVGCEILEKALIFGGHETTTSDVAMAIDHHFEGSKVLDIGDPNKVKGKFTKEFTLKFKQRVKSMLENVIDRMKTNPEDIPVLAVGGGSFIVSKDLEGASEVILPPFYNVSNAVGAAMGKISSDVTAIKRIVAGSGLTKEQVLEELKKEAFTIAINKGALKESIEVVSLSYDPIPYVDNTFQFIIKTIADVDYDSIKQKIVKPQLTGVINYKTESNSDIETLKKKGFEHDIDLDKFDYMTYKPYINELNQWEVSLIDLEALRIGTYILGCGGGGDPYGTFLSNKESLKRGNKLLVIDVDDVKNYIQGEGSITAVCSAGSPTVSSEQLKGDGMVKCHEVMSKFIGKDPELVFPVEIGGQNGMIAFKLGTILNIPVVDCDLMGRAYPTHWQTIPIVYTPKNKSYYPPTVITNGNGNTMIIAESKSDYLLEKVMRASLSELGCSVDLMNPPMSLTEVQEKTIHGSLSLSWRIGMAVRIARQNSEVYKMPEIILEAVQNTGKNLFTGKIVGVERRLFKGHVWGEVTIEELNKPKRKMKIPFKNENIYATIENPDGSSKDVVCSVPDLISVIDADTGEAVGTPDYRYGLIVFVLGISPSNKWTDTERAIEIGGPKGFGIDDMEYKPVSKYSKPKSVIKEFGSL